jgi:glycosyltransferase involved in cell wall biosynthesis
MKIGILGSRGIPNQYGGFEQFAEHLALGLSKLGISVWVYCSDSHPLKNENWNGVNRILCYDPEDKIGTAGQFIYDFNCIRDSRKRDFDIIYQLGYTSNSVWYRSLPDGPAIVTNMDGLEWKRSKYNWMVRRFLRYAEKLAVFSSDTLIADSQEIGHYLRTTYSAISEFIPYGADIFDNPNPESIKKEGLEPFDYFLLIARMQADNHIEEIINGVLNSNTETPLVIIGNMENRYGKYLRKKYNSERIKYAGANFNQEVLNNLRFFSKLYFHGHSAGGTNPSLLEAMAAQAFICAHNNPFNKEVLADDALYFNTAINISDTINQLPETRDLREQFINNNLKKITSTYNWDRIIQQYFNLFKTII